MRFCTEQYGLPSCGNLTASDALATAEYTSPVGFASSERQCALILRSQSGCDVHHGAFHRDASKRLQRQKTHTKTGHGPHDYSFANRSQTLWKEGDLGEPLFLRIEFSTPVVNR